jgi:sigma-B regulation protein RsbU (phosphoserine phosphatase)
MPGLRIQVYEGEDLVHTAEFLGLVEIGRQAESEGRPYQTYQDGTRQRIVIARLEDTHVSRRCAAAESLGSGRVRVTNLTRNAPLTFLDGAQLGPGENRDSAVPVFFVIGDRKIGIQSASAPSVPLPVAAPMGVSRGPVLRLQEGEGPLQSLAEATIAPGAVMGAGRHRKPLTTGDEPHNENMIRWIQAAMDVLQSAANSSEFFDKASAALVDLVGLDVGQVLLFQNGTWHPQARRVAPQNRLGDERMASRHVLDHVLAEKRTVWHVPAPSSPQGSLVGINAVVAAPILDRSGAVIGALYGDRLGRGPGGGLPPISKLEALLVELLAGGVAAGLARIEQEQAELRRQKRLMLYERELQIGRDIQSGFLPETLPQPDGWEVVSHFQPAREVAGDFFDAFPISANHIALVIADVCDKGVGASLFMALTRSLIRAFCGQTQLMVLMGVADQPPADESNPAVLPASRRRAGLLGDLITLLSVESTNRYVTGNHSKSAMFVTLCLCLLDTTTGELTYVNAGHESPTILHSTGIRTRLEPTGPAVGIVPEAAFDLGKGRLEPGDTLLMHTDGVTDARDPAGKSFSTACFLSILKEGTASAGALIDRLVSALRSHIGNADQFDDITLLAVHRRCD